MRTRILILLSLIVVLSSCERGVSPAEDDKESVVDILNRGKYWNYRTSDFFMDGGSIVLGFINQNGEIIYVRFDFSIAGAEYNYRRCFLQRSYSYSGAIEIVRGSELESKVIELIKNARSHEVLEKYLPSRAKAVEILKTRDVNLKLMGEAKPITSRKRISIPRLPIQPSGMIENPAEQDVAPDGE